jgi:hypothetical protein
MTVNFFSSSFAEAEHRFQRAAESIGAAMEVLPLDATGPGGEKLSISIARLGAENAENVLLHCSGLHGVEGFLGSALQLQLLSQPPRLASTAAIVIFHVINPYGMAWLRRVNQNNVDLNRNFRSDGQYDGAPYMYRRLNMVLNPESLPRWFDSFYLQAILFVLRHGFQGPKQAVGEGQYDYPKGLFYGGQRLEQESRLVLDWVQRNLASAGRIVSIDVHSGLGPYGFDSLLVHYSLASEHGRLLGGLFGEQMKFDRGTDVAYRVNGAYLEELEQTLPETTWYSITQEFGTYGILKVLKTLRDENCYQHYSPTVEIDHPTKRALFQAFCPEDPAWRRKVLERSRNLLEKATKLAFEPSLQPAP